jgi:hypothetical protein
VIEDEVRHVGVCATVLERRLGGPVAAHEATAPDPDDLAVGILSPHQSCAAAVGAVERWVIPSLVRLGVLQLPGH